MALFVMANMKCMITSQPKFIYCCTDAVDPPEEADQAAMAAAAVAKRRSQGPQGGKGRGGNQRDSGLVAAQAGLKIVRGAEVVEVRDEGGGLMNDFTGRVRPDERQPPQGEGG